VGEEGGAGHEHHSVHGGERKGEEHEHCVREGRVQYGAELLLVVVVPTSIEFRQQLQQSLPAQSQSSLKTLVEMSVVGRY
jgi:hypothetical protein